MRRVITARTRARCAGRAGRRKSAARCSSSGPPAGSRQPSGKHSGLHRTERKGHRPVDDNSTLDTRDTFELSHAAAQPLHARFDLHDIAGMYGMAVANTIDTHEENQLLAILWLGEDEDGAYLRHGLRQNRRWQRRRRPRLTREVPLVQ